MTEDSFWIDWTARPEVKRIDIPEGVHNLSDFKFIRTGSFNTSEVDPEFAERVRELGRRPLTVRASIPAPGFEDMDWTEPCLERGTTFSLTGDLNAEGIPVTRAWVKDEVLYMEGPMRL